MPGRFSIILSIGIALLLADGEANLFAGALFNGSSSEIRIPQLRYQGNNPLTVEFVVTPNIKNRHVRLLSNEHYRVGKTSGFGIGWRDGFWMVYVETRRGGRRLISERPIIDGRRVHLAVVFEKKRVRLYVNGRLDPKTIELTEPHIPSEQDFLLGTKEIQPGRKGFRFSGQLDAFRFSQSARYKLEFTPPDELEADTETLLLYQFDEQQKPIGKDTSGFGLDGVDSDITGVPSYHEQCYQDVSTLDPYVGTYQVERAIRGGGQFTPTFLELTPKHEVLEDDKAIGAWSVTEQGELLLRMRSTESEEFVLRRGRESHFVGTQNVDGKAMVWTLIPIRIAQIWTQTNREDKHTRILNFYSNGTFDDYRGKSSWTVERREMTLRWPRGWTNRLTLSPNRTSYVGTAPGNIKLEGVRLD